MSDELQYVSESHDSGMGRSWNSAKGVTWEVLEEMPRCDLAESGRETVDRKEGVHLGKLSLGALVQANTD